MDFKHPVLAKLAYLISFEELAASRKYQHGRAGLLRTALDRTLMTDKLLVVRKYGREKKECVELLH